MRPAGTPPASRGRCGARCARLITQGGVWPPHGLCRPCRGCWRLRPAPSRARGRAASRPSQPVRRTPPNNPAAIRCGRNTVRPRSPPPTTRAGHLGRRGGDPHPHRAMVRCRRLHRHLPHAAARRHSLRARSRLLIVALRTCHSHTFRDFVAVYFSALRLRPAAGVAPAGTANTRTPLSRPLLLAGRRSGHRARRPFSAAARAHPPTFRRAPSF